MNMNQDLDFEALPFETGPEPGGEMSSEEAEWRRRQGVAGRRPASGVRPRPPAAGRRRPFPPARRPGGVVPRRPWAVAPEPFPVQPAFPAEPAGSERLRWVQDCLNQALGLQLPVTGVMGPETRSAVRTFQQQQGLRASGIAGPDTEEALKGACGGQSSPAADDGGGQDDSELGPLTATLTWLPNNRKPTLFTRDQAAKVSGGGVYIVVESTDGVTVKRILKVGKAPDFPRRFGTDMDYRVPLRDQSGGGRSVPVGDLRFYLGRLPAGVDPYTHIERALARLLFRSGETLVGGRPVSDSRVLGRVKITNILPKPFLDRIEKAYKASGTDLRRQRIPQGNPPYPSPKSKNTLILEPKTFSSWELSRTQGASLAGAGIPNQETTMHDRNCHCPQCQMAGEAVFGESEFPAFGEIYGKTAFESPFSEAEEMDLVAELLSVSSEEELDQFLGKLIKGAWRGIKKVGRFVGKIAKPLGGVLKGVAKAALPFVGGALGSFIPIPGVGTALGSALGGALSKALETEFGELSQEEQEFEMARRFVRLAGTAARQAALAPPDSDDQEVVGTAVIEAVRRHLPNLPTRFGQAAGFGGRAQSGRWARRGNSILVLGA